MPGKWNKSTWITVIVPGNITVSSAGQRGVLGETLPTLTLQGLPAASECHPVATTPGQEFALSSASDGVNFLVGVRGDQASPDGVGAVLLSPPGDQVRQINIGRTMDGFLDGPRIASGDGVYLVVWTDAASQHGATGNDIYAQFVSATGDLVGSAFPVFEAPGDQFARGAAFDGSKFLVICASGEGLWGRTVTQTDSMLGEQVQFTADQVEEAASVAYGADRFLVTWVEGWDGAHVTRGRFLSTQGGLGETFTISQHDSFYYNPVSVAYGAGRFLVVWHHNDAEEAPWDLRGRVVLPDGAMATDELLVAAEPNDEFVWANNVVFDGANFFVVWSEFVGGNPATGQGTVLGRYWNRDGVVIDDAFTVSPALTGQLNAGLSSGNGRVVVVINRGVAGANPDVCARFVTRPFVEIRRAAPRTVEVTYGGILQSSEDLESWTDHSPQPVNPWVHEVGENPLFFRSRSE